MSHFLSPSSKIYIKHTDTHRQTADLGCGQLHIGHCDLICLSQGLSDIHPDDSQQCPEVVCTSLLIRQHRELLISTDHRLQDSALCSSKGTIITDIICYRTCCCVYVVLYLHCVSLLIELMVKPAASILTTDLMSYTMVQIKIQ